MELAFEKCDHIFLVLADLITFKHFSDLVIAMALHWMHSSPFTVSLPLILLIRKYIDVLINVLS